MRQRLSTADYTAGIMAGDRIMLSQAITVTESRLHADKELAAAILKEILPHSGNALRIGITGVPGVGKSTFIESFGTYLTSLGKRVAVLAVDPSSQKSRGSILGDKTRMEKLAHNPMAYIRPSATGLFLGGIAKSTREIMLLCEAAGYDIILIETVGVGQSETLVKGITDFFLLLMLAGAGDELQGIKKGIMEMADAIAINKADGDNVPTAAIAVSTYQNALHLFPQSDSGFATEVLTCSALEENGMEEIWKLIQAFEKTTKENGFFDQNRQNQNLNWMHDRIRQSLEDRFYEHPDIKNKLKSLEKLVQDGAELPDAAARELLDIFIKNNA
ncbi:methylmalonyl Co-A mutase-associated GTPase MeaB [Dyadobacter fanqingshengii]|uniref:Methylmalonyl Co-A mutase-associated GTPase MeaB n=1 Tax=Dyadobacter fanqingshengii TaxID=2906443 RepID=A0A9X1TCI6_9BACT|nr:methylmalonyl Co-A mutase-associated GTPase MeaB [Dyadobacter fanqingshengii]MCF0043608.1 methylmalonyl Co-A mutase-associated GTPase MeaB [Dyadobacter fanqingshengii]USJ34776.1 methylmalonyl Co-A mutase-associated GTPase MeaB [Dyadobacter fanqingshengii]